jgi:hypothetical protein
VNFCPDLPLCQEALNCSSLHLSERFSSSSGRLSVFDQALDFLSKIRYGKIAGNVQTMWIPVQTRYSLRQVRNSKSTVWTLVYHGPDARSSNMEIACIRSAVRMTISLVRTYEPFIRKLLAADVLPSERGSQTGKIFSEIFRISVAQLSSGRLMTIVRTAPSFIKPEAHLSPQSINRGPCA